MNRNACVLIVVFATIAQASSITATKNNLQKCTTNLVNGVSEVIIHSIQLTGQCNTSNVKCSQTFSFPLDGADGCTSGNYKAPLVAGYLESWTVNTSTSLAQEVQQLQVSLTDQKVTYTPGQRFQANLNITLRNRGAPAVVSPDSATFLIRVEIIALAASSDLRLTSETTNPSANTSVAATSNSYPIGNLQFYALTGFDLTASNGQYVDGSPLGINVDELGVKTTVSSITSSSFATTSTCSMLSDSPPMSGSVSTSCVLNYIALSGTSTNTSRVTIQPTSSFVTSNWLDQNHATPDIGTIGGAGAPPGALPTCGMKTFDVSMTPFSPGSPFLSAYAFKPNQLGFTLGDCDGNLLTGGLNIVANNFGDVVYNSTGSPNQDPLLAIPSSGHSALAHDISPFPSTKLTMSFELDAAAIY